MIITASYYNECSFAEKNEAHNIASVFKDDDIDIFDVYAYFFVKQRPISFDKFTRNIRKMLRVFGLSVDRMYLITYPCVPTAQEFQQMIMGLNLKNKSIESLLIASMYVPITEMFDSQFDIDEYPIHIPEYVRSRFKQISKDELTPDALYLMYSFAQQIKQRYGYTPTDYRQQRMKFLNTKGILIKQTLYRFAIEKRM